MGIGGAEVHIPGRDHFPQLVLQACVGQGEHVAARLVHTRAEDERAEVAQIDLLEGDRSLVGVIRQKEHGRLRRQQLVDELCRRRRGGIGPEQRVEAEDRDLAPSEEVGGPLRGRDDESEDLHGR